MIIYNTDNNYYSSNHVEIFAVNETSLECVYISKNMKSIFFKEISQYFMKITLHA